MRYASPKPFHCSSLAEFLVFLFSINTEFRGQKTYCTVSFFFVGFFVSLNLKTELKVTVFHLTIKLFLRLYKKGNLFALNEFYSAASRAKPPAYN